MEALSGILYPYKDLIGSIAGIVTIGQMFSGTFMCYDMYKQGDTGGMGVMPFLGGFIMGVLNLKYGYMIRDDTMILVNFVGLALSIIYLMVYFNYAQDKVTVWAKMGLGGAFAAAVIAYSEMEDPKVVEHRFGLILTAFMFWLIASPLFGLSDIIKNKSTEGLPFPMIFSGTIVTFMWLLYGVVLKNQFIVVSRRRGRSRPFNLSVP
ncbi:Sugar transporter SWEET1 [Eumeta japonica]|uniref:Sugar transporter SWEET1 n=1 Tax=Eumeta variegata TaxID=151549 RepID=A0A4C1VYE2_EUMVA|nr:Sugar transporter SWEET1 [Eumeta japonica]